MTKEGESFLDKARRFVQKKEVEELKRRQSKADDYEQFFGKDHRFSKQARKAHQDELERLAPPDD